MKEIIFSNLPDLCNGEISRIPSRDMWQRVHYTAGDVSGEMLYAGELCTPSDLRFKLGLRGWHKIFVATINMKSANYFNLRLSGDEGFSGMRDPSYGKKFMWTPLEYAEEFFWKCADLTDEELILSKPDSHFKNGCTLAWVRCVPMTADEVLKYNKKSHNGFIMTHFDEDVNAEDSLDSDEGLLTRYVSLIGTDVKECSMEISFDYDNIPEEGGVNFLDIDEGWTRGDREFMALSEHAYKLRCDFLHRHGIKAYATNRMSVTQFTPPYSDHYWTRKGFVIEHPEYYCKMRDGSTVAVCSYAYPEVMEYVIKNLLSFMKYGFDGLTLVFNRGLHIGFEEPVISLFESRYPGVDPRRLPVTDKRLSSVWCDFMVVFFTELRERLTAGFGLDKKINVIVDYSPKTSVHFGIDTERLIKLGLIDGVCQGIMEVYEDLEGCVDRGGSINIEKYKEKMKYEPVLRRYHDTDVQKLTEGAREHLEICDRYGADFYASLPWPHKMSPEGYIKYKAEMEELGVTRFLSWNTNHLIYDMPEYMAAVMGRKLTEEMYLPKRHRVTSLAGSNIAIFNPNWRG